MPNIRLVSFERVGDLTEVYLVRGPNGQILGRCDIGGNPSSPSCWMNSAGEPMVETDPQGAQRLADAWTFARHRLR